MTDVLHRLRSPPSSDSLPSIGTVRRQGLQESSDNSSWFSCLPRCTPDELTYHPDRSMNHLSTAVAMDHGNFLGDGDIPSHETFDSARSRSRSQDMDIKNTDSDAELHHACSSAVVDGIDAGANLGDALVNKPSMEGLVVETQQMTSAEDYHDCIPDDSIDSEYEQPQAFRRWLSTLRRRKQKRPSPGELRVACWTKDGFDKPPVPSPFSPGTQKSHHRSDSCTSSIGIVATMKSATMTLASASIAPLSRQTSKLRRRHHKRGSTVSASDVRLSAESQRSFFDEGARQRSRKRREKVEELTRTEESYVADIKALSNACFTLLGHQQSGASFTRSLAQKTLAEILHLHDDLLGELHKIVPFAEYDQSFARIAQPLRRPLHTRWHSVDVVPDRTTPRRSAMMHSRQARRSLNISRSSEHEPMAVRCSPQVVAAVATVFCRYMPRFRVYDDYGSQYETVQRDIEEMQRMITSWSEFDRAIEVLSATLNSVRTREANRRKALTVKDLLIKPIQRLPRYELLFAELCKLTPVCDDPNAHAIIEDLRGQLGEACQSMNNAKDNPKRTRTLETTWLLGDRLSFSDQVSKAVFLQLLGEVLLCGCLHVAYRSKGDFIKGSYAICILFSTTLLLANVAHEDPLRYGMLAGLSLANSTIEEADNGKGLQCHTAPHSWKVIFENHERMFEVILTACSATEANVWRTHLSQRIHAQSQAIESRSSNVVQLHSPLIAEMKSIGAAFGQPSSFVRSMSVHRSATVGPTTDLNQVLIKNTQAVKDALDSHGSAGSLQNFSRSQSVATPSHVQTLAPRRADRIRLESLLSDVWTREFLPYPGMAVRRSEQLRGSANHVIRKFSMASITSNFSSSKRNGSSTSIADMRRDDIVPAPSLRKAKVETTENARPARLPLSELLPADFDLNPHLSKQKRRNALRAFTMTIERPFSPLLGMDTQASDLRRVQSVRDRRGGADMASEPLRMGTVDEHQEDGRPDHQPESRMPKEPPKRMLTPISVARSSERGSTPVLHPSYRGKDSGGVAEKGSKTVKSRHKLLNKLFG